MLKVLRAKTGTEVGKECNEARDTLESMTSKATVDYLLENNLPLEIGGKETWAVGEFQSVLTETEKATIAPWTKRG